MRNLLQYLTEANDNEWSVMPLMNQKGKSNFDQFCNCPNTICLFSGDERQREEIISNGAAANKLEVVTLYTEKMEASDISGISANKNGTPLTVMPWWAVNIVENPKTNFLLVFTGKLNKTLVDEIGLIIKNNVLCGEPVENLCICFSTDEDMKTIMPAMKSLKDDVHFIEVEEK